MPDYDFFIKRGDTASAISSICEDAHGNAVDIQGAQIRFKMRPIAGGSLSINASATNGQNGAGTVDGSRGLVAYNWGTPAGTVGVYLAEWEATFTSGSVETFPNDRYLIIGVKADL